ncbi:hypothetical protein BDZ97DRAFT_1921972 [Flammula alnicola]|nr:hypothetical protein BDZ97DRAFT_1921972 [Flammula alnicola]
MVGDNGENKVQKDDGKQEELSQSTIPPPFLLRPATCSCPSHQHRLLLQLRTQSLARIDSVQSLRTQCYKLESDDIVRSVSPSSGKDNDTDSRAAARVACAFSEKDTKYSKLFFVLPPFPTHLPPIYPPQEAPPPTSTSPDRQFGTSLISVSSSVVDDLQTQLREIQSRLSLHISHTNHSFIQSWSTSLGVWRRMTRTVVMTTHGASRLLYQSAEEADEEQLAEENRNHKPGATNARAGW